MFDLDTHDLNGACLFGFGRIVIWILNRYARKADAKDENANGKRLGTMQADLVMMLENGRVIFRAVRTHKINGVNKEQERIIRDLFGVLKPNGYRQFDTAYVEITKKSWQLQMLVIEVALRLFIVEAITWHPGF
ncbi:MAG: hypothetical protein PHI83_06705 [Sphaerochaetaceae bacterium]|jgi:hypothetical protein|nr:hypothetical protein [Sphaerochaetaceae bacterium]